MAPSTKAWASGRVLSEAQRARKREHDKKSIREKRQSTQWRIAQLEETISLFLGDPTAANLCVPCLDDQTWNEIRSTIQRKGVDVVAFDGSKMI
jgi:hypothetical protein